MQPVFYDLTKNERVLWLTVIERAIHETMEPKPAVRQSAVDWLFLDQEDFPTVCEMAGLDCAYLRKKLKPYCGPRPIYDAVPALPQVSSDAAACCETLGM